MAYLLPYPAQPFLFKRADSAACLDSQINCANLRCCPANFPECCHDGCCQDGAACCDFGCCEPGYECDTTELACRAIKTTSTAVANSGSTVASSSKGAISSGTTINTVSGSQSGTSGTITVYITMAPSSEAPFATLSVQTTTSATSARDSNGLAPGPIVGIIIGTAVAISIFAAAAVFFYYRKRISRPKAEPYVPMGGRHELTAHKEVQLYPVEASGKEIHELHGDCSPVEAGTTCG